MEDRGLGTEVVAARLEPEGAVRRRDLEHRGDGPHAVRADRLRPPSAASAQAVVDPGLDPVVPPGLEPVGSLWWRTAGVLRQCGGDPRAERFGEVADRQPGAAGDTVGM